MAKVLVLGKYYYPFLGGIEDNVRAVAREMAVSNEVKVVAFSHERVSGEEKIDNVIVSRCKTAFVWKSQPVSLGYAKEVLFSPADVVHFHAPNVWGSLFLFVRLAFSKKKMRLVITHHMDIFGRPLIRLFARLIYDRLVSLADVVLVTSIKNARISNDLRVPCRIEAVPLGLDVNEFTVSSGVEAEASALRNGIKEQSIVAFIGRHARYKGLDLLLRAVAELPDVHLILAGDGPCTQSLKELSESLFIDDRVTFTGRVNHQSKLAILKAADVFAFPSTEITEAFGVSQLEAMAMNTPVVASNLPTGVTDVSVADVSAILVEPGSVEALREGLSTSLADRELAGRLASTAKHRVLTVFNNKLVSRLAARMVEAEPTANVGS